MPRKTKIFIILQLCIVFAMLFWAFMHPPLKKFYLKKTVALLYQEIIGRHALFANLPISEQQAFETNYSFYQTWKGPSYFHEIAHYFLKKSPFILAWLILAFLISLLLFFHIERARNGAWLLPILALSYGISTYFSSSHQLDSLFPTETYIQHHYPSSDLSTAWHRYLIAEWANEVPSEDPASFQTQVDKGLFAFNMKRLDRLFAGHGEEDLLLGFSFTPSLLLLLLFLSWNVSFAWTIRINGVVA